ncbi:hypothetical protein [Pelagicoccus sp. SDUM812003]|uniref:hypothetical protein n=1 Tax=Pelagicoccus sp. SDUM812003 TaxID=3041267 RepID=UPI0028105688|nr:hypothetical protein [Pelagicoccus sp. SDUM812003]MDQ8203848.1 hypothetical protein [Pelagicoccus sp. SDUM812003]
MTRPPFDARLPFRQSPGARKAVSLTVRLAASLALLVVSLFPNLPRLVEQFPRILHPERLVDPHFPGSDRALEQLQAELAGLPQDATLKSRVKAVEAFVKKHVSYETDWNLFYGNLHDWPTPAEVWQRKSDDCDGIAILSASLLQRLGVDATLEYNAFHCWTKIRQSQLSVGGAVKGPTSSREDGSVDWLSLAQDLFKARTWTEGLSFPIWRLVLSALAVPIPWLVLRPRRLAKRLEPQTLKKRDPLPGVPRASSSAR